MKTLKHFFWLVCCAALWFGLATSTTCAQQEDFETHEQPVQELFQTGLVYPQEHGELQFTYTSRFGKSQSHSILQTPLNVEYGITDNWQIELEWDAMSRRSEEGEPATRGRGDLSIGTQFSFMNIGGSSFHTAIGLEVSLPTGSSRKELSEGLFEYEPFLIVARDFPGLNNMQVFTQVGVALVQRAHGQVGMDAEEPAAHKVSLGVGMFIPFRRMVFTSEFNFSSNRWNNGGVEREAYATPGVVWRLPRNWEIGVGAPIGLTRDSERLGAVVKLVYEFNLLSRRSQ